MKKSVKAEVKLRRREDPERLIKRFIKKVKKSGILDEVREKRYYEKPSVIRNRKKRRKKLVSQQVNKKNAK